MTFRLFAFLFLSFFCVNIQLFGQFGVKFGLRAGANFSGFSARSEIGDSSQRLEQFRLSTKIAIGAGVRLLFSKRVSLGVELAFSQRGYYYRYNNYNSFLKVPSTGLLFEGHQRRVGMNIVNGYVEIPVLFQFEPVDDRVLVEVGPSVGFLISSRALGTIKYIDQDYPNQIMEYDIDARFLRDSLGQVVNFATRSGKIDGTTTAHPSSVGGYYFNEKKEGSFFNVVDFGINLGVSYFFTQGLRVGARGYLGLLDVTNNKMDYDQSRLDADKNYIYRKDRDFNFGAQIFVGLQF